MHVRLIQFREQQERAWMDMRTREKRNIDRIAELERSLDAFRDAYKTQGERITELERTGTTSV